jgi:HEAT repeat protein
MDAAIAALGNDPRWEARRDAAKALARFSGDGAFRALVEALAHDDKWVVRFSAATALSGYGDAAVEPLVASLRDGNHAVVAHAAEALGRIRAERAVEPLIETLSYAKDYAPVRSAREALVKYRRAVVPRLLSLVGDAARHSEIVEALADIGDPQAADTLLAIASNQAEKPHNRVNAVWGLGNTPGFSRPEALIDLIPTACDTRLTEALSKTLAKLQPGVNIESAVRQARKRSLDKYLVDLERIVPGMPQDLAESLSKANRFQHGANIVCNTEFGEFQIVVSGDSRVISTRNLDTVKNKLKAELAGLT